MAEDSFDEMVQWAVQQTISKTLGLEVWKAISFYFDFKTIASDPQTFTTVLEKLFRGASRVLQQVIGQNLVANMGGQVDLKKERNFSEWINVARAKFSATRNRSLPST